MGIPLHLGILNKHYSRLYRQPHRSLPLLPSMRNRRLPIQLPHPRHHHHRLNLPTDSHPLTLLRGLHNISIGYKYDQGLYSLFMAAGNVWNSRTMPYNNRISTDKPKGGSPNPPVAILANLVGR